MRIQSIALTAALLLAAAVPARAQTLPPLEADALARLNASPRHGEWVTVPAGGGDQVRAWITYPERPDSAPVVVVIPSRTRTR